MAIFYGRCYAIILLYIPPRALFFSWNNVQADPEPLKDLWSYPFVCQFKLLVKLRRLPKASWEKIYNKHGPSRQRRLQKFFQLGASNVSIIYWIK